MILLESHQRASQSQPRALQRHASAAHSRRHRCAALLYARSHTPTLSKCAVSCWHRLTQRIASRLVLASPRTTCPKASSTRFIPTCSQPYTHLSPVPPQKVNPNSSLTQPSQARTTIPWALDRCVRSFAPEPRRRWSPTAPPNYTRKPALPVEGVVGELEANRRALLQRSA